MIQESCLYIGKVFHKRHIPFEHAFTYRVFTLWLDIDELPALKVFSHNRFNVFSLFDKDHGKRDGSAIRPWVEAAAKLKGIDVEGGKIFMLTFPRVLGYVFNPITVYFCYDRAGVLVGVLHQVKNTFGEMHGYMLSVERVGGKISQECEKDFHVSPFIHMDCVYKFRMDEPDEALNFAIHQFTSDDEKILTAVWDGERRDLSSSALLRTLLTHPFLTLKIIVGIHWEALGLVMKGAKYIRKPAPPVEEIT